ncbi:DNA/RNA non-specific endonuclease [Luteimonas panaciterrae]|uniref:DNA/RNA non-specific endonuclease n=1 Tax=Luteimonas panaciterrae TaxID=363885 RepID=UPI001CFB799B|nr:DNA/RNA non-specific endonuclease [Luteimonas panaciterrae]
MNSAARLLSILGLWLAAHSAQAITCDSSTNDEYLDGRQPVLLNSDMNSGTLTLCKQEYNLYASKVTGTNLWSAQHLTEARVLGAESITRIDMNFTSEAGFPTTHSSYTNSGYDRGHMMPAGDASTNTAQKETFSIANVVPQTPTLNRNKWRVIEETVRVVAKSYGEAYIVTGPDFATMSTTINSGKVVVPTQTWKAVYVPEAQVAGAYWCENTGTPTCKLISINQLKSDAFVDAFPTLPSSLRDQTSADWEDILVLP